MLTNRAHTLACASLCALLVLAAPCGCTRASSAEEPSATSPRSSIPTTEPETEPTAQTGERNALVFFMSADHVAVSGRTIDVVLDSGSNPPDGDPATLEPLLQALLEGPSSDEVALGLSSAIPSGTTLNGVTVDAAVATVDLSPEFQASGDARSLLERMAQVVFTLTQFADIERVGFAIDGTPLEAPGGIRDDFTDVRPAIMVTTPLPGEPVTSPLTVQGESNTFEATFLIEVVDPSGQVVTEQLVSGGGGTGTWGTFSTTVEFEAASGGGFVVAYERSAKDGSRINEVRVPVTIR